MKIILFSDGTGNSSAKLFRTNVWRLYDALDLTSDDQVAFYDNGVGTASFAPLALLGGAFGWGLKRNVLDIYAFLCRNYHSQPGPHQIYLFGFSRGAFTMRVLLGLIRRQGLVPYRDDERELRRLARWAFRAYRAESNPTGGLVKPLRWLRDRLFRRLEHRAGVPDYDPRNNTKNVDVEFVGLFDTVAAYGLPAIELTRGWDRWVWPLSLPTRELYSHVKKACHALALDDERQTFHPLLWNERREPTVHQCRPDGSEYHAARIGDERVSQVWFAGMHSNVGGGYPDDGMAYDPLCWIAEAATSLATNPIVLKPGVLAAWQRRRSTSSPIADSRQGLASYYRYQPRSVEAISNDPSTGVHVARVKIHHSVFERRENETTGYAPIVLPEHYAVVDAAGNILDLPAADAGMAAPPIAETAGEAEIRRRRQDTTDDLVWLRRVSYFLTAGTTMLLLAQPLLAALGRPPIFPWSLPTLSGLISLAGAMLPAFAGPVVTHFKRYPLQLVVFGAIVLGWMKLSKVLQDNIDDTMRKIWRGTSPAAIVATRRGRLGLVRSLRTAPWYRRTLDWVRMAFAPNFFGIAMLAGLVVAGIFTVVHVVFDVPMLTGRVCRDVGPVAAVGKEWVQAPAPFATNDICQPMGLSVDAGGVYQIQIVQQGAWKDGHRDGEVPFPAGFASDGLLFDVAWPFKRHVLLNWFVPVARIGARGDEHFALLDPVTTIRPAIGGQLFLYVNDALALPRDFFYRNNEGAAIVSARKMR